MKSLNHNRPRNIALPVLLTSLWAIPLIAILTLAGVRYSFAQEGYKTENDVRFYQCQIEPRKNENFSFADVQCWLPPANQNIVGVLCIVLHPHNNSRVRFDNAQAWIALTKRYHCGLLAISFVPQNSDLVPWSWASEGSGRALLAAIAKISEESNMLSLQQSPIVIAGICEAGDFAYQFAAFESERVKAFLAMGGSKHNINLAGAAASIPALLIAATDSGIEPVNNMLNLFAEGRKRSAPWADVPRLLRYFLRRRWTAYRRKRKRT